MASLPTPIFTGRLVIRPPRRSDMNSWAALNRSPKARRHLNGPLRRPATELWLQLQSLSGQVTQPLAVAHRETNEFVGQCGFLQSVHEPEDAELYCVIRTSCWGMGYGNEICSALIPFAFSALGASRITGIVHPGNVASLAMVKKLGFVECGVCQHSDWQQGHQMVELRRERTTMRSIGPQETSAMLDQSMSATAN